MINVNAQMLVLGDRLVTMIDAISLLLICQFLGEGVRILTQIPIPGSILGMLLLLSWLLIIKKDRPTLKQVSSWLTAHLSIMFLPAAVGLINEKENIQAYGFQILLAIFISSLLTMAMTAYVFIFVSKRLGSKHE